MTKKVLLTGASGFVGTNILSKLLLKHYQVWALGYKNKIQINDENIKPIYCSLQNIEELQDKIPKQLDYIIHCAGLTKANNLENYYTVNTEGTKKLLLFCIKNQILPEHFIYISSIAAVGPQNTLKEADENFIPNPIKGYGDSKLLAEEIIKKYSKFFNWTIIRPPFIFGPYDYDTLNLFRMVKYGVKIYIGSKYFSFIYVEDLADAVVKILGNSKTFGQVFCFAYEKYTSQKEFLHTIATFVNPNARFIRVHPTFLRWLISIIHYSFPEKAPINRIKFNEIKQDYWLCASAKIKNMLGLIASTPLHKAVEKTYNWYKTHNLL